MIKGDPALSRYYTLYSEPAGAGGFRYVVRLVLSHGGRDTSQLEETVVLQPDASGKLLIHAVSAAPVRPLGKGPEVVLVQVADPTHIKVSFDSDLDPAAAQAIQLRSQSAPLTAQGAYSDRTVTLTLAAPLKSGSSYRLQVPPTVKDVAGRTLQSEYVLDFSA